jgi:hypothetical protein
LIKVFQYCSHQYSMISPYHIAGYASNNRYIYICTYYVIYHIYILSHIYIYLFIMSHIYIYIYQLVICIID